MITITVSFVFTLLVLAAREHSCGDTVNSNKALPFTQKVCQELAPDTYNKKWHSWLINQYSGFCLFINY